MGSRQFAAITVMCGAVALVAWETPRFSVNSLAVENAATAVKDPDATGSVISLGAETRLFDAPFAAPMRSPGEAATSVPVSSEPATISADAPAAEPQVVEKAGAPVAETPLVESAGAPAAEPPVAEAALLESRPTPPPEPPVRLALALPSGGLDETPALAERPFEKPAECHASDACIDDYLWSLYERAPKLDAEKQTERLKKTVKSKGKVRTITKTITKFVPADFTWKDPIAAEKAGMSLKDYVIGGMDRGFKRKLYHALRAMDDAGFMPGITSAFRDDYRQAIATGNKASSDSSYHGGSRRGGYGHGLAADLVSVKGDTRMERYGSSDALWKWIDANEKELGIGRPYRDRDPPHVGATDGQEFIGKRALANVQKAGKAKRAQTAKSQTSKQAVAAAQVDPPAAKPATPRKLSKLSSLQAARATPAAAKSAAPHKPSKVSSLQTRAAAQR
jgi:hypothetical protein